MVFYAYISDIKNDAVWRIVLVFINAATADEWWRAVSSSSYDPLAKSVQRLSPEFYTHNTSQFNVNSFFEDSHIKDISHKFRGKLIMTLMHDRGGRFFETSVNPSPIVDHVSGDWFFIRSTVDRTVYWHFEEAKNRVIISRTDRTMFRVIGRKVKDKTILIGSDSVSLKISPDTTITINGRGDLVNGGSDWVFDFGDLAIGRFVSRDHGLVFENVDISAPKKPGWELVN